MERMDIVRLEEGTGGTFGVLRMDGEVFCVTLEPPYRDNRRDVSCIPPGEYGCRRVRSPSFGDTYEIENVPGRDHILFHRGNVVGDTRGCVLLGRSFGLLGDERGVVRSRHAFREFLSRCGGADRFTVFIHDHR